MTKVEKQIVFDACLYYAIHMEQNIAKYGDQMSASEIAEMRKIANMARGMAETFVSILNVPAGETKI